MEFKETNSQEIVYEPCVAVGFYLRHMLPGWVWTLFELTGILEWGSPNIREPEID